VVHVALWYYIIYMTNPDIIYYFHNFRALNRQVEVNATAVTGGLMGLMVRRWCGMCQQPVAITWWHSDQPHDWWLWWSQRGILVLALFIYWLV
jgi:hypothetical protein